MNVTLYMAKGTLKIKLRILRRGGYTQLSGLAKCYHNSLYKRETGRVRERGVRTEAENEVSALLMEGQAVSQGMQVAARSQIRQENRFRPHSL